MACRQVRVLSIGSLSQTVESTVSCRSIVGTQAIVRGPKNCSEVKGINNRMGLEAVAPRQPPTESNRLERTPNRHRIYHNPVIDLWDT